MSTTARVTGLVVVVLLAGAASSCGQEAGVSGQSGAAGLFGDSTWQLVEGVVDGVPVEVPEGYRVTLTRYDDDQIGGKSACNDYGGRVEVDGSDVRVGQLGGTEMACEPGVMAVEAAYLDALRDVRTGARDGDRLVLSGDGDALTYDAQPSVALVEFVGSSWRLVSLVGSGTASDVRGEPATLRLDADGTLSGSTGCRDLSGEYVVTGDEVFFTSFSAGDRECPPHLVEQDSHVVQVLGDGFRATLDEEALTLTSTGDLGLVYRSSSSGAQDGR